MEKPPGGIRHAQARHERPRVVMIGSFRRHMEDVGAAMEAFRGAGAVVVSPGDSQVVAEHRGFPFVATDRARDPRLVEDRHLAAIRTATLAWLVCPDGEVGTSSAYEIGFASACQVPVFSQHELKDITIREYVRKVASPKQALEATRRSAMRPAPVDALLLDPDAMLADLEERVAGIRSVLDLEAHKLHGSAARRLMEFSEALRHQKNHGKE